MKGRKRRNLPAHIVLPNGMWRFVSKKGKKVKIKRSVARMAKRKRFRSKGASGMIGRGNLMSGLVRPKGILAAVILGAGAATIADNTGVSNMLPYGKYIVGGAVGGVGGVAGVFLRDMLKGNVLGGNISGAGSAGNY